MAEYSQKWHNGTSSRTRSTETFDRLAAIQAQLNNLGREIKKVNEKVYAAQVGCELCKGPHYTKDCPQKEEGKTLEEAIIHSSVHPVNLEDNIKQPSLEESLTKFMAESTKKHEENSNIIKEIRASTDAAIRNQGASIKTLEIQIGQMRKVLQERGFGSLPSSTKTNPRDQVKSISTAKGFTIIDDDMAKDVVLGMKFCKKVTQQAQMIVKNSALQDLAETMICDYSKTELVQSKHVLFRRLTWHVRHVSAALMDDDFRESLKLPT
ncbi:hypothetical protein Tco_0827459 [Tanacetum coccineum]